MNKTDPLPNTWKQGSFEIEIEDNRGCRTSEALTIVEPSAISGSALMMSVETCLGNDGEAVINPMGGNR